MPDTPRTYHVRAIWDADAQVYVCESDIKGLNIEAPTLDEFEALVFEHARALVIENHIRPALGQLLEEDVLSGRLIPGIVWERPVTSALPA